MGEERLIHHLHRRQAGLPGLILHHRLRERLRQQGESRIGIHTNRDALRRYLQLIPLRVEAVGKAQSDIPLRFLRQHRHTRCHERTNECPALRVMAQGMVHANSLPQRKALSPGSGELILLRSREEGGALLNRSGGGSQSSGGTGKQKWQEETHDGLRLAERAAEVNHETPA